jgi:RNA polymerase sigma factor (sigma-70 family)
MNDEADRPAQEMLSTAVPALDKRLSADILREVEQAYRDYSPSLLRFVRRRATQHGLSEAQVDTEGVVHDTFALAAEYWKGIADPPAWLFTVARRRIDRARPDLQGEPVASEDLADCVGGRGRWSSISPRASREDDFCARQIVGAIGRLPTRQRAATYLRHVHGWSLSEIADLLSCAPATAAVHVHRGTTKVRDQVLGEMDRRHVRYFDAPSDASIVERGMWQLRAEDYAVPLRAVVVRAIRRVLSLVLLAAAAWLVLPWSAARWVLLALGVSTAVRAGTWLAAVAKEASWWIALRIAMRRRRLRSRA